MTSIPSAPWVSDVLIDCTDCHGRRKVARVFQETNADAVQMAITIVRLNNRYEDIICSECAGTGKLLKSYVNWKRAWRWWHEERKRLDIELKFFSGLTIIALIFSIPPAVWMHDRLTRPGIPLDTAVIILGLMSWVAAVIGPVMIIRNLRNHRRFQVEHPVAPQEPAVKHP